LLGFLLVVFAAEGLEVAGIEQRAAVSNLDNVIRLEADRAPAPTASWFSSELLSLDAVAVCSA
jgi:hypothetical protein